MSNARMTAVHGIDKEMLSEVATIEYHGVSGQAIVHSDGSIDRVGSTLKDDIQHLFAGADIEELDFVNEEQDLENLAACLQTGEGFKPTAM